MEYLKNNICKFKPLTNIDFSKKKNIISLSFFKMYNGGYKNFSLYINGFKKLHKIVLAAPLNYTIRLFIDETIYSDKNLFVQISNLERVEIILYSSEKYKQISDQKYHIGLFGTLIRFFPLFDFQNNDANIVMIMDMDDIEHFYFNQELIKKLDNSINKIEIIKSGNITKNVLYKLDMFKNHIVNPYVIAPKYIGFKRINKIVIEDFFEELSKDNKKIFTLYEDKIKVNKKMTLNNMPFIYGVDEYFLNINLTNYLIENKIPFGVYFNWEINGSTYNYLKNKNISDEKKKLIGLVLDYILNKLNIEYSKNDSIYIKYKKIDTIIYSENPKDKEKKNILLYYFYKLMIYFYNNTNYRFIFEKDLYNLIKDFNLFGYYEFVIIIYYNLDTTTKNNYKIIKYKKFSDEEINRLKIFSKKYAKIF